MLDILHHTLHSFNQGLDLCKTLQLKFDVYMEQLNEIFVQQGGKAIASRFLLYLQCLEGICDTKISNAILWTYFVTPHGDQTQHDQTKQVSYYMKGESEDKQNAIIVILCQYVSVLLSGVLLVRRYNPENNSKCVDSSEKACQQRAYKLLKSFNFSFTRLVSTMKAGSSKIGNATYIKG